MIGWRLVWVNDPINKRHDQPLSLAFVREGGLSLANNLSGVNYPVRVTTITLAGFS